MCGSSGAVAAATCQRYTAGSARKCAADAILLPLQGPFPATFPLLPDLVILEMDHNRFKCAPCFIQTSDLANRLPTVFPRAADKAHVG